MSGRDGRVEEVEGEAGEAGTLSVKNNRLYVTNNRTWAEEVGRTYGASLGVKPWSAEVKQKRKAKAEPQRSEE